MATKTNTQTPDWQIYIPEEGHWPIAYNGTDKAGAKTAYLKWAGRKSMPRGSRIDNFNEHQN